MAGVKGRTRVTVFYSGPLFDGRARALVKIWLEQAKKEVAAVGDVELHAAMGRRFKHPTGHYESMITQMQVATDQVLTDPVIYGPWLEGTSKRNQSTRFKGYHIWRRTRQKLRKLATPIAQRSLDRYIEGMN